ncbi:hypothetical protein AYL99_01120 [Fonsecaea erecta]|uniref:Uncharacterized protein n=1 Tax=Fonsecaea erecta TaxID=1367422 RepID=A0A178ZZ91_9EURO|nr:hypothetical protein AYL99_01120 [Fonsecaea erecta]OAP65148.1 hypothetical protein AYL99_01120 [Fonsecaea erecta]
MAVQRTSTLPEGRIPVRTFSLSNGTKSKAPHTINPNYVTWPAPDGWYTPPRDALDDDAVQPFPDFPDPSKTLIIERTLLLDQLYAGRKYGPTHVRDNAVFEALLARIAPSGHIKHDQDLSHTRSSVRGILAVGENYRAQRSRDNKVKLPSGWTLTTGYHPSNDHSIGNALDPKVVLRWKLRDRCDRAVHQARIYARDFGMRFSWDTVNEGMRAQAVKRATPTACDRAKVVTALTALHQTFPGQYQAIPLELLKTSETSQKESSEKLTSEEASQEELTLGKQTSPSANDTEESPASSKHTHTFASVRRMTSSFFRGLMCNGNVGQFSGEKSTPQSCAIELDSFPVVVKMDYRDRTHKETSESLFTRKHLATREFVIEAGIIRANKGHVSRGPAHPNAPTAAHKTAVEKPLIECSSIGITDNNTARGTLTEICRPVNPPHVVEVKTKNKLRKFLLTQKSSLPAPSKAEEPQKIITVDTKSAPSRPQVKVDAQHHHTLSESKDKLRAMMARLDREVFGVRDAR